MKWRSICLAVLTTTAAVDATEPPTLEYVAVGANTGSSAGGHSGLRVGDHVYHYQAGDDMILLLKRDPWDFFLRRYSMLDNRSLTLSGLDLRPESSERIVAYLDRLRVVQQRHVDRLAALKVEVAWLTVLDDDAPGIISLPTVGLFDASSRDSPDIVRLRSRVGTVLGPTFVQRELAGVDAELAAHALEVSRPAFSPIIVDQFPDLPVISAERLRNRLLLREALITLSQAKGLAPKALMSPGDLVLSSHEHNQLLALSLELESAVVRLLQSPRPDRGAPLLLATARFEAIQHSLRTNQWLFLDAVPRENILMDAENAQKHTGLVQALAAQAREAWEDQLNHNRSFDRLSPAQYGRLEAAASRYLEPLNALRENREVWAAGPGNIVPVRRGPATPTGLHLDQTLVSVARSESDRQFDRYDRALRQVYEFSLLRHNCTTEIAGAIQSAFPNEEAITSALGGVIDPGKGLSYIPINLSKKIRKHWFVTESRNILSWRKQQVTQSAGSENSALVRLREANTITASYPGSIHDDAFLLFADGNKLLRPLQGTANLGYGAINAALGAFTLPVDGGRRAWDGLRGAFYSVPEMIGISIRKGRYDIVPSDAKLAPISGSGS